MKSSEVGLRQVAPLIDRLFRFLEMIGVTALLSVILPSWATAIQLLGTELALYYLVEPLIDNFTYWMVPEVKHKQDLTRMLVLSSIGIIGVIFASGSVAALSAQISRTISITPEVKPQSHIIPSPR